MRMSIAGCAAPPLGEHRLCIFATHNGPPTDCQRVVTQHNKSSLLKVETPGSFRPTTNAHWGIDARLAAAVPATIHHLYGFDCSNSAPHRAGAEPVLSCALSLGLHRGLWRIVDAGHVGPPAKAARGPAQLSHLAHLRFLLEAIRPEMRQ